MKLTQEEVLITCISITERRDRIHGTVGSIKAKASPQSPTEQGAIRYLENEVEKCDALLVKIRADAYEDGFCDPQQGGRD